MALKATAAQSSSGGARRLSPIYPSILIITGMCVPAQHPPLGSLFDLRSLKLARALAVAFFFGEAMLSWVFDVLG